MRDPLAVLDKPAQLSEKLRRAYAALSQRFPFIERLAFAAYDPKTDTVKTYLQYGPDAPIRLYEAKLSEAKSLHAVHRTGQARVVNDMDVFRRGRHKHTKLVAAMGYRSSYTLPIRVQGEPCGFPFLNARQKGVFTPSVLSELSVYAHLIAGVIAADLGVIRTLVSTVQAARDLTDFRDEFVEHVFLFAPLHDVGKVAIPDKILRKPGPLTEREFAVMKTHTTKGRRIIDEILRDFGLEASPSARMLRHIAEYHHEAVDGTGYPKGLRGEKIPIEARITAVADVFDALTSRRRYKAPWSNRRAFAYLAGRRQAAAIQRRFRRESGVR